MNDIIHEHGDKLHNGAKTNPDVRVQQLFDGLCHKDASMVVFEGYM